MTEQVAMEEVILNGRWTLKLPHHRAIRPEWKTGWEVERLDSMSLNIEPDDIVFDIGSEEGDITALLATWTRLGDGGVVPFEPNPLVWANLYAVWKANNLNPPLVYIAGFAGDVNRHLDLIDLDHWPESAYGPVISDHGFCNLRERPDIPSVRIDDLVGMCSKVPSVLNIDVEGSELCVLEGAIDTLKEAMPLVFCSVHDAFMREMYDQEPQELYDYMGRLGYRSKILSYDHELHVAFWNPFSREFRT